MLYARGILPDKEKARIESHLTGCEICSDMLEGYLVLGDDKKLVDVENEIAARLEKELFKPKENKKTLVYFRRIAAAASILLVTGLSVFYLLTKNPTSKQVAQKNEKIIRSLIDHHDTILIARNEPLKQARESISDEISTQKNQDTNKKIAVTPASTSVADALSSRDISPAPVEMAKTTEKIALLTPSTRSLSVKPDKSQIPMNNGAYLVTGKVTDANGESLPGVNVVLKGTTQGTVTDMDGRFRIQVPDSKTVLTFSFIGFTTEEVKVLPGQEAMIAMVENISKLEEVVVIGYGTQKKRDVTGSISAVPNEKKQKRSVVLQNEINSLKETVNDHSESRSSWLQLTKKYLEAEDRTHALETLEQVKKLTDRATLSEIDEIILLVQQQNLTKALRKLKKIK